MCGDIMQVISDIIDFMKTLTFVDVTFFLAVLSLMVLVIVLIYFVRENSDGEKLEDDILDTMDKLEKKPEDNKELVDLLKITKALEEAEPQNSNLNLYEEEQEEKAIISYDELIKKKNDFAINYSEEKNIDDDLTIKKVDLNNLINKEEIVKPEIKVTIISYEKEEAFLEALKRLQQTLN